MRCSTGERLRLVVPRLRFSSIALTTALIASLAMSAGCSIFKRGPERIDAIPGTTQDGMASWYGPGFHGNATANGEIFDQYDLTAAHRTLPLGTRVRVTNRRTRDEVVVRINDRGPYVDGRILDLSYAAATRIHMIGSGVAPVRLEVLAPDPTESMASRFTVRVRTFEARYEAETLRAQLRSRHPGTYIDLVENDGRQLFRVAVGSYPERQTAVAVALDLVERGVPALVVTDGRIQH